MGKVAECSGIACSLSVLDKPDLKEAKLPLTSLHAKEGRKPDLSLLGRAEVVGGVESLQISAGGTKGS